MAYIPVFRKDPNPEDVYITPIQIRLSDIDFFGHVHAARVLEMVFTARRNEAHTKYRKASDQLVKDKLGWVIEGIEIQYLRQLMIDDNVEVYTWTHALRDKECDVGFRIFKNGLKLASEGIIHFALVRWPLGRSVKVPDEILQLYRDEGLQIERLKNAAAENEM